MAHRTMVDLLGRQWDVWDTRPGPRSRVSDARRSGWLTFESLGPRHEKRRLSPIPEEWFELDDIGLTELLGRAMAVRVTTRSRQSILEESSAPALQRAESSESPRAT